MPFRLSFEPLVSTSSTIPPTEYFQDALLKTLSSGNQMLFKVMAQETPTSGLTLIGHIVSRGPAVKSKYADDKIMFGHNDMGLDLQVHPEWTSSVPFIKFFGPLMNLFGSQKAEGASCPLGFGKSTEANGSESSSTAEAWI